ncbi:MAG: class I tRNA ligase family protein [Thermoflexales bacterium]|nr:class I tRNA ligase family protein [Thermoflexales bacterium]
MSKLAIQPVSTQVDFSSQERDVLAMWARTAAFERLRALRANATQRFSFVDGPITANNPMGVHHAWGRSYKDLWQRYKAMRGMNQRWQNGFDCQGLWVEVEVEKTLELKSKRDIEEMGIEKFIRLCKQRVLKSAAQQTEQSIRLGYWMDWNDPSELRQLGEALVADPAATLTLPRAGGAVSGTVEQLVGQLGDARLGGSYFTFSDENNYQIWGFLKECHKHGWVYRGGDVIPWCPRCATGISQHEMEVDGYKDVPDPAFTVRMKLITADVTAARWESDEARAAWNASKARYALAWTTTPWTLPANVMCAVGPKLDYAIVRQGDACYVLGARTLKLMQGEYERLGTIAGAGMDGWTYEGLYDELPAWKDAEREWAVRTGKQHFAHHIILWDDVGEEEGSGIVHNAPGCGPEDYKLGRQFGTPAVAPLDEQGNFMEGFGALTGRFGHDVPNDVERNLRDKGYLYRRDTYMHRYPHCWRCKTKLLFRQVDEWYISMDELRHHMMRVSGEMNWIPEFGKERELDWLRNMHDWMISKKRYWGLALPIWEYPDGSFEVIGSRDELKARAVEGWETFDGHTPHRPWIDGVKIKHPVTGQLGTRVKDVGNPWLDAGIVAYSTLGYRSDRENWAKWFPADFITESFPGQFRNWFYSLIAMSTVLESTMPARTVLGFATLFDEKGEPMHKSKGNSIEFNEAAERAGADVMRWTYARQKYDDNLLFGWKMLDHIRRDVFIPLWNVYAFFCNYASIDGWSPEAERRGTQTALDRWVLARLAQVTGEITAALEAYDARTAAFAGERFIDDLSKWYVRRSRERFWRGEMDADKRAAYETLYEVLTTLCRLLAPFVPFITEAMWQNLGGHRLIEGGAAPAGAFSVHHEPWPATRALSGEEQALLDEVAIARTTVNLGHSLRAQSKVKVRQPLARIFVVADPAARVAIQRQEGVIADELNVKAIEFTQRESDLVTYRVLPDNRKLGPKLGADFPKARAALAALDAGAVAAAVRAGREVVLQVNGANVALAPDEILVQAQPREGLVVEGADGIVVGLDTTLTPALLSEGLSRDVIRRLNDLRKSAGLKITDRIHTEYAATPRLAEAIGAFSAAIAGETLSVSLLAAANPAGTQASDSFDGETLTLGIRKA